MMVLKPYGNWLLMPEKGEAFKLTLDFLDRRIPKKDAVLPNIPSKFLL